MAKSSPNQEPSGREAASPAASDDSNHRVRAEIANRTDAEEPSSKETVRARGIVILAILLTTLALAVWSLYRMIDAQSG